MASEPNDDEPQEAEPSDAGPQDVATSADQDTTAPAPTATPALAQPAPEAEAEDSAVELASADPILPPDQWPSFACDGELDAVEEFLCTNSQAASTDLAFAEFWATHIAERAGHPLLDQLVRAQQGWIESDIRFACLDPDIDRFRRDDCMRKVYLERQNALTYARLVPIDRESTDSWSLGWGPFEGIVAVNDTAISDTAAQPDTRLATQPESAAVDALVDLAEAELQLRFQSNPRFGHSSGSVDVTITPSHGQRLSAYGWSEAGFIQPSAHPYFNFREFIFDRDTGIFIEMSDLVRPEHVDDAATVLVDSMVEVAGQGGTFSYLRELPLDDLEFRPVFDDAGLIIAFENNSNAESLGSYAGRICFYGLRVPASRLVDYAADDYASLFSPDSTDAGVELPNCS